MLVNTNYSQQSTPNVKNQKTWHENDPASKVVKNAFGKIRDNQEIVNLVGQILGGVGPQTAAKIFLVADGKALELVADGTGDFVSGVIKLLKPLGTEKVAIALATLGEAMQQASKEAGFDASSDKETGLAHFVQEFGRAWVKDESKYKADADKAKLMKDVLLKTIYTKEYGKHTIIPKSWREIEENIKKIKDHPESENTDVSSPVKNVTKRLAGNGSA